MYSSEDLTLMERNNNQLFVDFVLSSAQEEKEVIQVRVLWLLI